MDLKEMLRNLGLEDIFEESKADFSRMTKTPSNSFCSSIGYFVSKYVL